MAAHEGVPNHQKELKPASDFWLLTREAQREQLPPSLLRAFWGRFDSWLLQCKMFLWVCCLSFWARFESPGLKFQRQKYVASLNSLSYHPFNRKQQIPIVTILRRTGQACLLRGALQRQHGPRGPGDLSDRFSRIRGTSKKPHKDLWSSVRRLDDCSILIPISLKLKHPFYT